MDESVGQVSGARGPREGPEALPETGGTAYAYVVDGVTVIELHGEIDLVTVAHAGPLLDAALTCPAPRVIVDLRPTAFFDCSALALLCRSHRRALENGGCFALVCTHPWHLRILRTARLSALLRPQASVEAALSGALLRPGA
ncbi:STAS domain-containing protein [Streptomyces sp. NPDC017529]|uniref:STAS domain-containing protein n=1 Tax=Streptomyces sp. NPDC017529 TaxID=3365000 RepID=UPI00379940D7